MAWLHTWAGLLTGWVLFFVFVTGTAGYVDDEITRWMQPELPAPVAPSASPDAAHMLAGALARLAATAPPARSWTITLPHQSLEPRGWQGLSVAWEALPQAGQRRAARGREALDPVTAAPLPRVEARATGGGEVLYRMHYLLHYLPYGTGIKAVGICTMLMLLAVVTGVVTHKKIFTDFFTFRPGKGQRSWLDAHNVVSVLSLPFFLMITYSGLVFFAITYLPAPLEVVYGGSAAERQAYVDESRGPARRYAPVEAPQVSLAALVRRIEAQGPGVRVASLQLVRPQGEPAYIDVRLAPGPPDGLRAVPARYGARDGAPLASDPDNTTARVRGTLFDLHEGLYAQGVLRVLYVVSGLLGCAVIGTGLVLWTAKRQQQHARRAHGAPRTGADRFDAGALRLVEALNAGTLVGLPLGLAGYFWANRLLPVTLAGRADWEVHCLFLVWGAALLYAALQPIRRVWLTLSWLTVAAYAALPALNALTTDRHLGRTLPQGDWDLAGFDLSMLGLAAGFAWLARRLGRRWRVARATTGAKRGGAAA